MKAHHNPASATLHGPPPSVSKRKYQIDALFHQGARLHGVGRLAEAEQVYRQVLSIESRHADTLHMLGVLALQAGHPAAAADLIGQAIAVRPSEPMYYVNRAHARLALGQAEVAAADGRAAVQARRNCAEGYQVLGHALVDLGRADEALGAYQTARQRKTGLPGIENDLGLALCEANRLTEAVGHLEAAVRQTPGDPQPRNNLAGVLRELGRLDDAEAIYRQAIRLTPEDPALHVNLAIALLLAGRLREGWAEWEWRWQARPEMALGFDQPRWEGEPLNGRTLLIHAEQGLGSNIQFCRYVNLIPPEGRVVLAVQPALVRLMTGLGDGITVAAIGDTLPKIDLRCPMLSLPRVLGTNAVADIPANIPYLRTDPAAVARWQRRAATLPGLRVGLVWAGNPEDARMDRRRSMPPAALTPLADLPGVSLVSLQVARAATALPESSLGEAVHDWTAELSDFVETAALIEALDLVISADTAAVHLAGALGKPVWLLNRFDTCWRWLLGRDDSPWYPTLRQFRQTAPGRWDEVVARVRIALADQAERRGRTSAVAMETGAKA
jgi:Flp pilus assembly protein TadD